jgi:cytidine deaminase
LVGADGQVYSGCNVENASFGLTICAERSAITRAIVAGERHFRAIAIATDRPHALFPCGACRQVLAEFAPDLPVFTCRAARARSRARRSPNSCPRPSCPDLR